MARRWLVAGVVPVAIAAMLAACHGPPGGPDPVVLAITVQPQSRAIPTGRSVILTVTAVGSGLLRYQWYAGASGDTAAPIAGAGAAAYATPALAASASYWVRVSDAAGSVDSATATLTVVALVTSPAFEQDVLTLVNARRAAGATCGGTAYPPVAPLVMHALLRQSARAHSEDMALQDYVSHDSLDGRTFVDRIRATGYAGSPIGENIAAGYPTPAAAVQGWMDSPGHCANIMQGGYTQIGVGYVFTPVATSTYRHYWTQNFGG